MQKLGVDCTSRLTLQTAYLGSCWSRGRGGAKLKDVRGVREEDVSKQNGDKRTTVAWRRARQMQTIKIRRSCKILACGSHGIFDA